jgi:hypothetical protein
VADVPSWQEKQVPSTWVWSTREAGSQAATTWHDSQVDDDVIWVAPFPEARVPSWHETQLLAIPVWSNLAGVQAVVAWQLSHSAEVGM